MRQFPHCVVSKSFLTELMTWCTLKRCAPHPPWLLKLAKTSLHACKDLAPSVSDFVRWWEHCQSMVMQLGQNVAMKKFNLQTIHLLGTRVIDRSASQAFPISTVMLDDERPSTKVINGLRQGGRVLELSPKPHMVILHQSAPPRI